MKRFASHYLYVPTYGYFKQYVVEMEEGLVSRLFPLTEEVESAEWLPGVIALLTPQESIIVNGESNALITFKELGLFLHTSDHHSDNNLIELPDSLIDRLSSLTPYLFSPFDIITMQPVDGTRHKQLR